jgi:inhibitor of cysteine peptidase
MMKTKIALLVVTIIITLIILPSCSTTPRLFSVEVSCDQFTENPNYVISEFETEIGDKITVKLCSNATTGFNWEYVMTNENAVKEEDHDFEEAEGDMVGAAGVEVWTFKAVEKGTTEIQMKYGQPWEGGIKAEWTCTMSVTVN